MYVGVLHFMGFAVDCGMWFGVGETLERQLWSHKTCCVQCIYTLYDLCIMTMTAHTPNVHTHKLSCPLLPPSQTPPLWTQISLVIFFLTLLKHNLKQLHGVRPLWLVCCGVGRPHGADRVKYIETLLGYGTSRWDTWEVAWPRWRACLGVQCTDVLT